MRTTQLKSTAIATIPAIVAFLAIQACGNSDPAVAQEVAVAVDPIEGVWEGTVTFRDCTTSAALGGIQAASSYHRGGTMSDTNASPTASRGPGFGTWVKAGSSYTIKFRFFAYDATGAVSGVQRVTRTLTLGANNTSGTGSTTFQLFDLNGAVVRSGCASDVANRVL